MLVAGAEPPEPVAPAGPPAAEDPEDAAEPKQVFNLSMPVSVHTRVEGTSVDMHGGHTKVDVPASQTTFHMEPADAPIVNVDAPRITVNQPDIKVQVPAPNVYIQNDVTSPEVNVAAPDVKIDNHVESPTVNIEPPNVTFEATMPEAQVVIQPVTVKAPDVHITNELPDYETVETEAVRDKVGKLVKTVTTKRRKR